MAQQQKLLAFLASALAFAIASPASAGHETRSADRATERVEGEVVLSSPQCGFFVVETSRGFSLLDETEYYGVFEGDQVRGALHSRGVQDVEVVGEATLPVMIEEWGLARRPATRAYYRRCRIAPDALDEEMTLARP
jgi:hypothetical protein